MTDGSSSYSVIIKALIDTSGVQAQINNAVKNKTVNIRATISGGDQLKTTMGTLQNQLDGIKIKNADAFKNPEIVKMGEHVQGLITNLDGSRKATGEARVAIGQLKNQVSAVNESFRSTTTSVDNFSTTLMKDAKKVLEWMIATSLIIGTLQQVREGIQYVEDLNKAMTNIGMVTGQTAEQLNGMVTEFNSMARELGVDTLAVAEGAGEWIRQGKNAADTMELLRSSTMMSKLGNLEAADATDKLIAVTNAYNISAKDSIQVVDTLIGLDNSFATSTSEIASAMQKSASMAKLAGVSYKDLASYITVISATTRQSGETIGQALLNYICL
jgi:hypothetical protein